jgi:hypothetical protein
MPKPDLKMLMAWLINNLLKSLSRKGQAFSVHFILI